MDRFWIDVGGTFTDCVWQSPAGTLQNIKILSSGVVKGRVERLQGERDCLVLLDSARIGDPDEFWTDWNWRLLDEMGKVVGHGVVEQFSTANGQLALSSPGLDARVLDGAGLRYELFCGDEAPLIAIRRLLRLPRRIPLPPLAMRLGTTRGTNALLERRGAETVLVTTQGFRDLLAIGHQDRPHLFELNIRKPRPLYQEILEAEERIDASGQILIPLNEKPLREQLCDAHQRGLNSCAVALLHAWRNPEHEQRIAELALAVGFQHVSVSHQAGRGIKFISRGETTVLDAYLTPLLRDYVAAIRARLHPASSLQLMTSGGGLVSAEQFSGKDSLLSGPAGGVIGSSRTAVAAGFSKSIAFDMGGTSTDVSRFDGRYEREFESEKAGVRVMTPVLAIETVAAGGGSLCQFDGVKLTVGPHSAGAEPGPACYGGGGPLTITDCNVYVGRIPVEQFPFPLNLSASVARLREVAEQCDSQTEPEDLQRLALGFIAIANANMARAIRRISVAKGYDPAEYVLSTFGGAGGQHCCAVADLLGISRVLIHPLAGCLSAYGIGLADERHHVARTVLRPLTDVEQDLPRMFAEMQTECVAVQNSTFTTFATATLRYRGTESALEVPEPIDGLWRKAFEQQHQQLYGYTRSERGLEVVDLHLDCVIAAESPGQPLIFTADCSSAPDVSHGLMVIPHQGATIFIDVGWTGTQSANGAWLLERHTSSAIVESSPQTQADRLAASPAAPSPILLEIYNHHFASIAEQMGVTLQRTAVSTNVKERLDFSCAVFDAEARLIANAPHIPVHLGAMGQTVRAILDEFSGTEPTAVARTTDLRSVAVAQTTISEPKVARDGPKVRRTAIDPGDVFITNDPYRGGSHLPDVTVVTPVHDDTGTLRWFVASRAHHAEIGGIVPGSMPPFSRTLAEEGVLITPFKLLIGGQFQEAELIQRLTNAPYPTRRLDDNLADIAAQVAANQTGVKRLRDLVAEKGGYEVAAYMRHLRDAAAQLMRNALSRIPNGVYQRTDHLDDGTPIAVRIEIANASAVIDFAGTGPVSATNLNANSAIVTAAVMYVLRCLIDRDVPLNAGVLDPVTILLPDNTAGARGCLLNPPCDPDPARCPAIAAGNVETSQRIVDTLLGALQLAADSQGTMNNLSFGDGHYGYYETLCGGSGATSKAAGADAVHTHMTNTRLTDVELLEHRYPVRVRSFAIRRGSGGLGLHRGGDGVIREIEFLQPATASLLTQRRGPYAPSGLAGGQSGALGRNELRRAEAPETTIALPASALIALQPGDLLSIHTPGGGGYGVKKTD